MSLHNFLVELDEAVYQTALEQARKEGKTLEHILAELITTYARGGSGGGLTTYTVQRGDTLARIARKVYGDPHRYPLLQQANNISDPGRIWVGQVLVIPSITGGEPAAVSPPSSPAPAPSSPSPEPEPPVSIPSPPTPAPPPVPTPAEKRIDPCTSIPEENYGTLPIVGSPTDRPAAQHGDLNLALRSYSPTGGRLSLIDIAGPTDHQAPQLAGLFADKRIGVLSNVYRVNQWNWGSNSPGGPVTDFEVTLAGFEVEMGETIHVPEAGYSIGQGYTVLVLYADQERITLKYTGEDSVVNGYTIHVEGVCVEPSLLSLYQQMNNAGRRHLPALRAGQAFGRARESEIRVAIRDTGRFMDPRSRKDWWSG